MKYVMFKKHKFVIFPETMSHSEVACVGKPVGAGNCSVVQYTDDEGIVRYKVEVWGKSDSLNIPSRTKDAEIMTEELV